MTNPETASLSQFAAILGCSPSWVTQLRQADRLVLTDDNKRVRVAESIARIEATEDPAKRPVAARHAAARTAAQAAPEPPPRDDPPPPPEGEATVGFQHWRERSERAKALAAERENDIAAGKLLDADQVAGAIANAGTMLRTRLENLPDALAPRLAVINDEKSIRTRLREEIEHALDELARQFNSMGKAA